MGRCIYCADLTIQRLVEIAESEPSPWSLPRTCYYKHQPSVDHLEASALAGCDLCSLIVGCLKGTVWQLSDWDNTWQDAPPPDAPTLFSRARLLNRSNVKLCLDFSHGIDTERGMPEAAHVMDLINVHLGSVYQSRATTDSGEESDEIEAQTGSDSSMTSNPESDWYRLGLVLSSNKGECLYVEQEVC